MWQSSAAAAALAQGLLTIFVCVSFLDGGEPFSVSYECTCHQDVGVFGSGHSTDMAALHRNRARRLQLPVTQEAGLHHGTASVSMQPDE